MKFNKLLLVAITLIATVGQLSAQSLEKRANKQIKSLESLITKANKAGINTLKEQTAIRTAEIFLGYADWDDANVKANTTFFEACARYKDEAQEYAEMIGDWQRNDIITMLEDATEELTAVINGDIVRLETPNVDWERVSVNGDELLFEGKPVFLTDWTWKPRIKEYTEFHGNQDGFYLSPTHVVNKAGDIAPNVIRELESKGDGALGFIFLAHSALPSWATEVDPTITEGQGIKYTAYDIHNPLARKIQSDLYSKTIPLMAGKKYTELGYMLCNEPHWNSVKGEWAAGEISERAYADFIDYLEEKHGDIATLNKIWGASYSSFDSIDIPRIREAKEQGTPLYFDFMRWNMARVNEWFAFLSSEVKKYDPAAKTQIKIMPNLWSDGKRDSGIDMEAIIRNTDIIGNDASTCGAFMWGKPQAWEASYSYNWREICMAYDFFKSISPNKVMYNTEGHMLSTNRTRDLYQTTDYVRNNYWLAHIHGLTAMQTWYWARREDGSCRDHFDANGYAASNNHQPRVVNEVHATMLDLNSVSDYIMAFQRQRKPIRIFYTEASAINSQEYIEDIYNTYEKLFFEGTPIGFATQNIIEAAKGEDWDVIVVSATPQMFNSDVAALQQYLNDGGTVIIDSKSMLTDEYNRDLDYQLNAAAGKIIRVESLEELTTTAFKELDTRSTLEIVDQNGLTQKGCTWREIEGENGTRILNLVNLSRNPTTITVKYRKSGEKVGSMKDILTGTSQSNDFILPVDGVLLLETK